MLLSMCVPPQWSMCLTAVTFSSLKTNTDSEQVVFLNNVCSSLNYISRFGIQGAALLHKWKQFSWDISNLSLWKAREIYCIRSITVLTDSGMSFHQNAFLCPLLSLTPLSSPHPYPFKLFLFPGSSWFCNSAEGRSCCFTQMSPRFTLPAGLRDHSH